MAPSNAGPLRRSTRKRGSTSAEVGPCNVKKRRSDSGVFTRIPVNVNSSRRIAEDWRQSPDPMSPAPFLLGAERDFSGPASRSTTFDMPYERYRTQSVTPNPPGPHGPYPTKKYSLKARLQDVVKIIVRQNVIRKLTSDFAKPLPSSNLRLCDSCAALGLVPEDFVIGSGSTDKYYGVANHHHGSFMGIYMKARVCPLCRLIMKGIAEQPYAKLANVVVHGYDRGSQSALLSASCAITWEVDGRVGTQHKTRRLQVKWDDPCFENLYLFLVGATPTLHERLVSRSSSFLARKLGNVNQSKIGLIQEWLRGCERHTECIPAKGESFEELRRSAFFGVIDVVEMRFRPLPEGADYVTLSYQWGPPDDRFTTTLKTVMAIRERNGLSQYLDKLPLTIREVIDLVRDLHLRYLWIDSICIVQDSRDAWDRNAGVMDLVYGNSCLTICAADGDDANAGLRAISHPHERAAQSIEKCNPGLELMARYPLETYVTQSNWNIRAWTFQERLLSKRCLIFIKGRIYFQCRRATMCEDIHMTTTEAGSSLDLERSPGQDFKNVSKDPLKAYRKNVKLYTARVLTKPVDILSAFCGVGKLLCEQLGGESVFGLPNSHFDWALLWDPEDSAKRRAPGKNISFPSWSWCGWDNRRMLYNDYAVEDCMLYLHDWLMNHTWITWYMRDGNGDLRLVWDSKRSYSQARTRLSATMHGYSNPHDVDDLHHDFYGREIPECSMGLQRNEFNRTIPDFPVQVRALPPGKDSSITMPGPDRGILQFWTWSAYFYLHPEDTHRLPGGDKSLQGRIFSRRFSILDANRTWAGTIVLDKKWKFDPRQPQHFIAISDARQFWYSKEGATRSNYSRTDKTWPLYNVLLLGYDEKNQEGCMYQSGGSSLFCDAPDSIAYRVGLGKIYQEAFDQACKTPHQSQRKEWKEIVLG